MPFIETKVYSDGSHYIGIPHTTRPKKKREPTKPIIVEVENEMLEEDTMPIEEQEEDFCLDDMTIIETDELPFPVEMNEPKKKKMVNLSAIFEGLYRNSFEFPKRERRSYIVGNMQQYFQNKKHCEMFVDKNIERKRNNLIARRTRMMRKINLQEFNYFCTFTYDENKMSEDDFKKKLKKTFANLCNRKHWKYIGVWELSPEKKRLHFHGLFYIPENGMIGELIQTHDYSVRLHKVEFKYENTYFKTRFGVNDFSLIDNSSLGKAMIYLTKYLEKSGEKIVYSRGLPTYFISDILDSDVMCFTGQENRKIVLADDFTCIDEGEIIGIVSKDTISKMRHAN